MIKKIILILTLVILSVNVLGTCENINMDVAEVQKNESCYTFFSAVFEDSGCESNCFVNASTFIVVQGDKILTNKTGITTTFFGINYRHPDCNEKNVYMKIYDDFGNIVCEKNFNLDDEYVAWQKYNKQFDNQTNTTQTTAVAQTNTVVENQKITAPSGGAPGSASASSDNGNTTNINNTNQAAINAQALDTSTDKTATALNANNQNNIVTEKIVENLNETKTPTTTNNQKISKNLIMILTLVLIIIAIISVFIVKMITKTETSSDKKINNTKKQKGKKRK